MSLIQWFAHLFAVVAVVCAHATYAQPSPSENPLVMYDPLFWKHELKLDKQQSVRIQHINVQFYDDLRGAATGTPHQKNLQSVALKIVARRSDAIWNTFNNKQKKKWAKIAHDYAENKRARSSMSTGSLNGFRQDAITSP